ncbi:amino acid permease [Streptosporangium sp. NBC_01756]|uniref:amino acid permease n=1 Tax=Streptosporangium sp. NBC_01756 TaxID=2975950 RepID=UPI002DD90FF1|nr:amino acid permease [Streptosporangium sp. NBC_01756]WSC85012.1 amino acid permease [Streptosporangium sp. NBC_01756]
MEESSGERPRGRIAAEEDALRDGAAATPAAGHGKLGLPAATSLVVGNIVGTGVFLLPASLAAYGTVGILAMGLVSIGAIALAVVFGRLGARVPAAGGPYAYAKDAFGEFPGFWNAWSFWLTAWIGNAAIAVVWVNYANYFLHWDSAAGQLALALAALWIPALINLSGVRNIGMFTLVTTVLKFIPLIFVAVVGLFFVRSASFGPFNATDGNWVGALSTAGALALFIYSGVESVTIVAEKIKDPARNIGRASVYGVLICAAMYLLSTVAIFGTVPHAALATSSAPFADAINNMFGGGIGGGVMAACAVVSGIGAINGWTMLVAEMPMAAARDGLFPQIFTRENRRGAPWVGIVMGTALTTLVALYNYFGTVNGFDKILLIATFTTIIPYFFSACAQLFWLATGGRTVQGARLGRDLAITAVAILFGFWMAYGAGTEAVFIGFLMMLVGIPVYIWAKAKRGEYGPRNEAPAPRPL